MLELLPDVYFIYMKYIHPLLFLLSVSAAHAQTAYTWSYDQVGLPVGNTSGGSAGVAPGGENTNVAKWASEEGVVSADLNSSGWVMFEDATAKGATINLTTTGDSMTIDMGSMWSSIGVSPQPTIPSNFIYQIGLIDSSAGSYFGNSANDSIHIAGLETAHIASSSGIGGSTSADIQIRNESSSLLGLGNLTFQGRPALGDWYEYGHLVTFTNMGSGNMKIDYKIDSYLIERQGASIGTGYDVTYNGSILNTSSTVAHGLDLSSIRPGVGVDINDRPSAGASGVAWDGAASAMQVPEPSSSLLFLSGLGLLAVRRKR